MFRRVLVVLALLLSLLGPTVQGKVAHPDTTAVQTQDCTVYITKTGHKYHLAGCQYLKNGAIKMSRNEAIKVGYSPCKRCGGSSCETN
jgi:hypothetical protein